MNFPNNILACRRNTRVCMKSYNEELQSRKKNSSKEVRVRMVETNNFKKITTFWKLNIKISQKISTSFPMNITKFINNSRNTNILSSNISNKLWHCSSKEIKFLQNSKKKSKIWLTNIKDSYRKLVNDVNTSSLNCRKKRGVNQAVKANSTMSKSIILNMKIGSKSF